ncbi:MAG: DNA/RNA non-specific endonuclease [Kiritimatiellae bacterium]|nr:DNA/RNA non-specific endonuclease [Kiritimatiellia bacterium]
MAIEAVAAVAVKEIAVEAAKEAAVQAAREIAQKMATEAAGQGRSELQAAMMERQTIQDGFRIGEMPETKGEVREIFKQKESGAVEELREKLDAEESSFNADEKEAEPHQEVTAGNDICNVTESEHTDAKWDDCRCDETKNGKPVYEVESGKDSELLNGKLPEKSVLEIDNPVGKNHIQVETNGMGRNIDMKVDRLEKIPGELRVRDVDQQRLCRQMKDGRPGDDGGHLLASEFGGPKEQVNLSPMNSYINRHGEWRRMEKFVEKSLDGGKSVTDYRVKSTYEGESFRPEKFTVSMKVDGVPKYFQIKNPITNPAMAA